MVVRRVKDETGKDYGTSEIARRFRIVPILANGPNGGMNAKVVDDNEVDKLLLNETITIQHHGTLMSLMGRLIKANFVALRSPSLEAPVQSDQSLIGDRRANLIRSINAIFKQLDEQVGQGKRKALIDLLILDAPWPGSADHLHGVINVLDDILAPLRTAGKRKLEPTEFRKNKLSLRVYTDRKVKRRVKR
jgi:hypothetical protein